MVPVGVFFSRVLPNVIGCPEPLAQQAVVDAAIEFCEATLACAVDLDPVDVRKGVRQYELDLPPQMALSQILSVIYDDFCLVPIPSSRVVEVGTHEGHPVYYYTRDVDETLVLNLYPTPDKNILGGLRVRAAVRPTRTATQVHSSLFNDWSDAIVDLALARLMDTPGQPFTNEAKAVMLRQKAKARMTEARLEALRGRTMSSMSVSMRRF